MIIRIYEQEFVTLDYDSGIPCVISTSLKFMTRKQFKSQLIFGYNFMKEKMKETGRVIWIADATLADALNEDHVKWLIEDWTHYVITIGITHLAFVLPESGFAQVAIDDYSNKVKGSKEKKGTSIAFFKDVESAKKWFRATTK